VPSQTTALWRAQLRHSARVALSPMRLDATERAIIGCLGASLAATASTVRAFLAQSSLERALSYVANGGRSRPLHS
jgi:hypothetical protein